MKDFKATNTGNRIVINCATMEEVKRLKQVILRELKESPLGIKLLGKGETALDKEVDITGIIEFIKNTVISIETSDEFDEALFACLSHCTYKTSFIINKDLFENDKCPEAREDYYEIVFACVEENLRPFAKSLVSALKTQLQLQGMFQKLTAL